MPSNYAYSVVKDHFGYLWIGTDKGVAKYNGYNVKIFDLSKGFINKDTWYFFEDKKGRVWLYNISNQIGYIYNDQYHKVYFDTSIHYFYPRVIGDYKEGVFIQSSGFREDYFFVERNDTLHAYKLPLHTQYFSFTKEHELLGLDTACNINKIVLGEDKYSVIKLGCPTPSSAKEIFDLRDVTLEYHFTYSGNHLISYKPGRDYVRVMNYNDRTYRKYALSTLTKTREKENVLLMLGNNENLPVVTKKHIYIFDETLKLKEKYFIDSVIQRFDDDDISSIISDSAWGKVLSTFTNGVYIAYGRDTLFKRLNYLNLTNFSFVGSQGDSICYWWNNSTSVLARIKNNADVKYIRYKDIFNLCRIIPFNKDSSLILGQNELYILDNHSLKVKELDHGKKQFEIDFASKQVISRRNVMVYNGLSGIISYENAYYLISKGYGFYILRRQDTSTSFSIIYQDRFKDIIYDSVRGVFWAYGKSKVLTYKVGNIPFVHSEKQLEAKGVNSIEKMLVDNKYGNIFLLEGSRLLFFTDFDKPYQSLFDNYVLNDAKMFISNNTLMVAGTFGVLFSKIEGSGKLSGPIVYPNIKGLKYACVYDGHVSDNKLLLKTNKGTYLLGVPKDKEFISTRFNLQLAYKLILDYNDKRYSIGPSDTILIQQKKSRLQFDVIKPDGVGQVKYKYRLGLDSNWRELANNELSLPPLSACNTYVLSIIMEDYQWRSSERKIYLYIVPYWWQKPLAKKIIWTSYITAILLLFYLIIIVTKRTVTKQNAKRNLQLELELKSIYAQINPHFIFNSLNAAMYLVKTKNFEGAYSHINKFSNLLRSYIKSSRNRLIKLSEELINLKNYIELQQARFKDRFEYEIIVDPLLDINTNIPSLLLQPVVENAIIHGLLHKEDGIGYLKIEFRRNGQENEISCVIDDNGVGRKMAKEIEENMQPKKDTYGTDLLKDLTGIFGKYMNMKIEIEYKDKELPFTGTIVTLRIKDIKK